MSNSVSRRNLTKGAAWAVPAVTVAAAAPAMAASPVPKLVANNTVTFNELPDGDATGDYEYRVYTSPNDVNDPPNSVATCGHEVTGANAGTTVTNVSMTYWLLQSNLTFAANSVGVANQGWSVLTRSSGLDGSHTDNQGRKLYAYITSYSGPLVVNKGTICLGVQNFISTNSNHTRATSYDAVISATINGKVQTVSGSKIAIS